MRLFILSFLLTLLLTDAKGETAILPADGVALHYRLIGFTFPVHEKATAYRLEIFEYSSNPNGDTQFRKLITKEEQDNKIIATVPAFGKNYMWQVKYLKKRKLLGSTARYFFSVTANPFSGADVSRVMVIDSASKYKDLLLFFDNTRTLHNMAGEPLWYLPVIKGVSDGIAGNIRDIKMTAAGTITFLTTKNIHEIDYYGNVLWSGPNDGKVSGDTVEQYHHEFTRLSNGNYMAIANKLVPSQSIETNSSLKVENGSKLPCGTIVEYNSRKEIVWTWNSCDYIKMGDPTTHFNSFYFDEQNKVFYTSYRNISRVVKAAYPSGKVLAQYGEDEKRDGSIKGHGMFYAQHNVGINSDGNLHLFNNNFIMSSRGREGNDSRISSVAVFREPLTAGDTLQKIWEVSCDIDTFTKAISSGGGSVCELDKGDYLVCMGLPGRNFIVSKDKKIIWNVITKNKDEHGVWIPFAGYRISLVNATELDKLLFRQ